MPIVSSFFGIVVRMFYREHGTAHFHAEYQGEIAAFRLDGSLLAGSLGSKTACRLVEEWARQHRSELERNWERARSGDPMERISPLE